MPSSKIELVHGCASDNGGSWIDLGDHKRLDLAGVGNMGANTEIDHWAAAIDSSGGAIGDLGLDKILLILVVLMTP